MREGEIYLKAVGDLEVVERGNEGASGDVEATDGEDGGGRLDVARLLILRALGRGLEAPAEGGVGGDGGKGSEGGVEAGAVDGVAGDVAKLLLAVEGGECANSWQGSRENNYLRQIKWTVQAELCAETERGQF